MDNGHKPRDNGEDSIQRVKPGSLSAFGHFGPLPRSCEFAHHTHAIGN